MIGAIFNPDDEVSQQFEFLGEAFDLSGPEVVSSLSQKTLKKLHLLDEQNLFVGVPMSKRELAAVVGLSLFASGSGLRNNEIYLRYPALRFYRDQISGPIAHKWDASIGPISTVARQCFVDWLADLKRNTPRPVPRGDGVVASPDVFFTDASDKGWGAIHCRPDGSVHIVSAPWSAADHQRWNLASSVASEQLAVSRALCCCITPGRSRSIVIYTDHEPIPHAVGADCAKAFSYWCLQSTIRQLGVPHPGACQPCGLL